jgi:hypothetical protein
MDAMKQAPMPLVERLEMAAHACHCAGLLSCEASVREAIVALSATTFALDEHTAMLLAAISTASIQNTRESAKERIGKDNPCWTQAYEDVCTAVDREMALRERLPAPDYEAISELMNIVHAQRFNRDCFQDDTDFADWAQSRCRHTLASLSRNDIQGPR